MVLQRMSRAPLSVPSLTSAQIIGCLAAVAIIGAYLSFSMLARK